MDARGRIYFDENGVPTEDAARLDGYLKGKAEQGIQELLEEKTAALQAQIEEMERAQRGPAMPDPAHLHLGQSEQSLLAVQSARIAQRFHEHYERMAPLHGYETRAESAVPWADVPDQNKRLMVEVARALLVEGTINA